MWVMVSVRQHERGSSRSQPPYCCCFPRAYLWTLEQASTEALFLQRCRDQGPCCASLRDADSALAMLLRLPC
jgi:hypothetical protein